MAEDDFESFMEAANSWMADNEQDPPSETEEQVAKEDDEQDVVDVPHTDLPTDGQADPRLLRKLQAADIRRRHAEAEVPAVGRRGVPVPTVAPQLQGAGSASSCSSLPLPRPSQKRPRPSDAQHDELVVESEVARELGLTWTGRGPPGPKSGGPATWRNQNWREGSQRWSNRGGAKKNWYSGYYAAKKISPEAVEDFLKNNPKK